MIHNSCKMAAQLEHQEVDQELGENLSSDWDHSSNGVYEEIKEPEVEVALNQPDPAAEVVEEGVDVEEAVPQEPIDPQLVDANAEARA